MSDQPSLFDQPTARASDPETSHMAAVYAMPNAGTNRYMALVELNRAGIRGLTDFDLEAATGIKQTSIGKRRKELCDLGLAERQLVIDPDSLQLIPGRRLAPSGTPAAVWVITEAGRAWLVEHPEAAA